MNTTFKNIKMNTTFMDLDTLIYEMKARTAKECYIIEKDDSNLIDIFDNKIGGYPYLPIDVEYPKTNSGNEMVLLLQVNLKDINLRNFPQEGILEIFVDADLNWPTEYKVLYFKDTTKEYQTNFDFINMEETFLSKATKISLVHGIDYIPSSNDAFLDTLRDVLNLDEINMDIIDELEEIYDVDIYDKWEEVINTKYAIIGGYPGYTQNDILECVKDDFNTDEVECIFKLDNYFDNDYFIGDCGIINCFCSVQSLIDETFKQFTLDWDCC